jgi:hypothetical protein
MNKSEIKVQYAVRHVSSNSQKHNFRGKRGERPVEVGRRNSTVAATLRNEFITRPGENKTSTPPIGQQITNIRQKLDDTVISRPKSANPITFQETSMTDRNVNTPFLKSKQTSFSNSTRPVSAPKRRPPMLYYAQDELKPFQSWGKIDREEAYLIQDNNISIFRKSEWGKSARPPDLTENVLGPDNCDYRKTIRSSTCRTRFSKTSGPITNLKQYKPRPVYYPPAIYRDDIPPDPIKFPERKRWELSTQVREDDERAKPIDRHDMSSDLFHEYYRPPIVEQTDCVIVTQTLDNVAKSYPKGRFS